MEEEIKYLEDYKLVDEYLCGNRESGKKLYEKLFEGDVLKKYIYKRTSKSVLSIEDKEEIFEETLKVSVEKLDKYNGKSEFKNFVIGIAENKCKEKIRKVSNSKIVEFDDTKIEYLDDSYYNLDPAVIVIKKEEAEKIKRVLSELPAEDKQIIQLRIINGVKPNTISELIGEDVEDVYYRCRQAIKKFKKIYEKM